MRRAIVLVSACVVLGATVWLLGGAALRRAGRLAGGSAASPACRWVPGHAVAFDVAIDSTLTFDESALVPGRAGQAGGGRTETAAASGRLDARVLSVTSGGAAVMAVRLSSWTSNAVGTDAFPAIDADMRRPYLLQVDPRCHVVAAARPRNASVIAYRRVLAVLDRMDFAVPPSDADPTRPYTNRQLDDFGWYALENRYERGAGRGSIARRRVAYDAQPASGDALPVAVRIRSAGGSVVLGDGPWFAKLEDEEDLDVVSNGRVPLHSRSTSAFAAKTPDAHAFDDVTLALDAFTWGRPTDAELQAAHDALRGSELAGLPAPEAVERFFAVRDGGKPGAWHEAQRVLRDWMRGNPAGVESLGRAMAEGRHARKDQADFTLAMAKSGSPDARRELERLAADASASTDLRVQAASACGDLKQPTTATVDALARIAAGPRNGTPDDMLPSTATMSLGAIIDNAPGTPAAAKARSVLQRTLRGGDHAKTVEALHAASNSGDPAFTAAAVAKAGSTDAEERAAGVHALRKMPPSQATGDTFETLLHDDTDPEVVKQVAGARRQQIETYGGQLSDREVALYATKLPGAPEGVRWEILRTLGTVSRVQPVAQQVLVDWYREEPTSSLRMVIGQYVPASALRN